jgi:Ca-activated chloride channel family protein
MIVAAARPQWGEKLQVVKGHASTWSSRSTPRAACWPPTCRPSRLERAKVQIASLLDNLSGNRVGIVAFRGERAG